MSLSGEQEYTTEFAASAAQCFATITDFARYPEWFSTVEQTRVVQRYRNGLAKQLELHVNIAIRTIRYILEYKYEKPSRLTWKAVEGDIEAIEGGYLFEKLGPARTRVTCRQAVSIGFWVPGPIRAILERHAVKQSVLEFKAAAEAGAKSATAEATPRRRKA